MTNEELLKRIQDAQRVLITCHRSPDGDAIGSSLGLHRLLHKAGIHSVVMIPDPAPSFLHWMTGYDDILIFESEGSKAQGLVNESDVIFCLDYNNFGRTGDLGKFLSESSAFKVLIDHHIDPSDEFDYLLSDTSASSTSELVHRFALQLGILGGLDKESSECLYAGIMTDTGSFKFSSTSAQTHRVVADFMDAGLVPEFVHHKIFDTNSFERLQLIGYALSKKLQYDQERGISIIPLSLQEKNRFKYQKGDTEGLVNYGLSIKGSKLAIFLSEELEFTKCSLRSKGEVDVNQIARAHFNGGGHKNAAGGRLDMTIEQAVQYAKEVFHHKIEW